MYAAITRSTKLSACVALGVAAFSSPAKAIEFGGVDFPQGTASFADLVIDYSPSLVPGSVIPTLPHQGAFNALGAPDFTGGGCATQADCTYVSLGRGGSLTLSFLDNKLTGSGSSDFDLWIFEIGPDVEDTFVEISKNGSDWFSIGKVFGSTSGIDIDVFGFDQSDEFGFVRLTDDPSEGGHGGGTPGADIDAVGAISTVLTPVDPNPNSVPGPLPAFGAAAAFGYSRKLRKHIKASKVSVR
jgi:hypothetical protein